MRHRTLLALAPLLVLALVGAGSALWSEQLSIDGTVETSYLDGGWTFAACADFDPYDIGEITVPDAGPAGTIPGLDRIGFKVAGAFPGYVATCSVVYAYFGAIMARVGAIEFEAGGLTGCVVDQRATGTLTATCDQMDIIWTDGLCTSLEPGDTLAGNLRVEVRPGAAEATTYDFELAVVLEQADDSGCPD